MKGYTWEYDHLGIVFRAVATDGKYRIFYADYSEEGAQIYDEYDYDSLLDGFFIVPDLTDFVIPLIGYANSMSRTDISQQWIDWVLWFVYNKPMLDCVSYIYVALSLFLYEVPEYQNDTPPQYIKKLKDAFECEELKSKLDQMVLDSLM